MMANNVSRFWFEEQIFINDKLSLFKHCYEGIGFIGDQIGPALMTANTKKKTNRL